MTPSDSDETPDRSNEPTSAAVAGARFITRFEARSHLHRLHPVRLWRLGLGFGLLLFGIVNIFIPGPGGSVIILAALLVLAGESKLLARLLDRLEVRYSKQIGWALEHKLAAVLIVSACTFAAVSILALAVTKLR